METAAALIDALYTRFVLRDLVAKVAPGLVIELSIWTLVTDSDPRALVANAGDLHGAVIASLFALAWTIGFAAQTTLGVLMLPLRSKHGCHDTLRPASDRWVAAIAGRTRLDARDQQALERLSIIKEANGNLAVALVAFTALSLWRVVDGWALVWGLAASVLFLALFLARYSDACRREVRMQEWFEANPRP